MVAIELFEVGDELLANEVAPRVHNSGHWTIEGAETSQFEQHLRAVHRPARSARPRRGARRAMVNLIGDAARRRRRCSAVPGAHLHLYGKSPRPARKLGHVTVTAPDATELNARLDALADPHHLTFVNRPEIHR